MSSVGNQNTVVTLCQLGDLEGVRKALVEGMDVNGMDVNGNTGLIEAVMYRSELLVKLLIKQTGIKVDLQNNDGATALHMACTYDNTDALRLLVDHPSMTSLNIKTKKGDTPIMMAVKCGSVNCVRDLVALGADLKTRDKKGRSLQEVAKRNDYPAMLSILNKTETDPLWESCLAGDLDGLREALARGEDLHEVDGSYGLSGLMWIVFHEGKESYDQLLDLLLQQPSIDVNQRNNKGNTALHMACVSNRVTAISMLVSHPNVIINAKNSASATPLMLATQLGKLESVRALLALAGVDLQTRDSQGSSLQEVARQKGHTEILEVLEKKYNKQGKKYICFYCHSPARPKKCRGCQKARYCSTECQEEDWARHQNYCRAVVERRERGEQQS